MVLFSNIFTSLIILLITLILNGDWGNQKIPFYGFLKHQRFVQQPYCLLYFYIVSSFIEITPNTMDSFWLFLFLVVAQIGLLLFIFSKYYQKQFIDWSNYINRIKQILGKAFEKKSAQNKSKMTLQDIVYFLQNLVFPSLFVLSNAYLIVQIFINSK